MAGRRSNTRSPRQRRDRCALLGVVLALLGVAWLHAAPTLHRHEHAAVHAAGDHAGVVGSAHEVHGLHGAGGWDHPDEGHGSTGHHDVSGPRPSRDSDPAPHDDPEPEGECGLCRLIASARPMVLARAVFVTVMGAAPTPTVPVVLPAVGGREWRDEARPRGPPPTRRA